VAARSASAWPSRSSCSKAARKWCSASSLVVGHRQQVQRDVERVGQVAAHAGGVGRRRRPVWNQLSARGSIDARRTPAGSPASPRLRCGLRPIHHSWYQPAWPASQRGLRPPPAASGPSSSRLSNTSSQRSVRLRASISASDSRSRPGLPDGLRVVERGSAQTHSPTSPLRMA
jgi:hypothetical protein